MLYVICNITYYIWQRSLGPLIIDAKQKNVWQKNGALRFDLKKEVKAHS